MLSKAKILPLALLMAAAAFAALACSQPPPAAPAQIDEAQLSRIVAQAVADAQPAQQQQVTPEQIHSMVQSAMMDTTSAQSMEIQSMVEDAVSSAASEGASASEIRAMVESAVNAATADAVTGADVQSAISQAVADAQANAITAEDVEAAVSSAVMQAASNSMTPEQIQAAIDSAFESRGGMMEDTPKETIVFSDLNWTSAQVQNRIAQYIVKNGYGFPTDQIFGATLPNFQGLQKGDIHVTMEVWLPNQSLGWEKAVEVGEIVSVGTSLVGDWQSTFVVPKYIADANPDLVTPQDLKKSKFQELFATDDSRGKARHVSCVIGWSCEQVNSQQIETYELSDSLHVINPGSQEAMFAELYTAFENEDPWLGYMWGTGDPALKLDLVRLEEEPYSQECWDGDKGCAFAESLVLVAVHKTVLPRAPEVIGMLQNWDFTIDIYKGIFQWMDSNEGSTAEEAAIWFLNNNDVWESWVTDDAAAAVNSALDSGVAEFN